VLYPEARRAAALWAELPGVSDPDFDIEDTRVRSRADGLAEPKEPVDHVADIDAGGIPCRLYVPAAASGLLLQLHGGGWAFGDLETHDAHCRRLANRTRRVVLAVDYRLAPEHPYPAAPDDVDVVVGWLRSGDADLGLDSIDTARVAAVGDSAGGQLALVAGLRNPSFFDALALVYPVVSPPGRFGSYDAVFGGLMPGDMDWYWDRYVPDCEMRRLPDLNPLDADLSGLPPTLVLTAENDPLVDEGEALAAAVAAAGVPTVATRHLGMIHGFFHDPRAFAASPHAVAQVAAFLNEPPRRAAVAEP
jgi:acetyl esterase/lipase